MADVFISYNREDQHRAREILEGLTAEGLDVWWDSNLKAGDSYDEVTEHHLRTAGAVVVLWSKRSVTSKWVRAEATVGERSSILVPAMIEPCDRPLRFELIQTADLINWHGNRHDPNWEAFVRDIKQAIGHHEKEVEEKAAEAPVAAGPSADGQLTIENTFWTSIKDGSDKAEFEAYIKRYPNGHFVDLAKSRIAALERTAAAKAKAAAAPKPAPQQSKPSAPRPTTAARPTPAPEAPKPATAPHPEEAKKGPPVALLAGVGVAVVAAGALAFMFMGGGSDEMSTTTVASTENLSPVTEDPAPLEALPVAEVETPAEDMALEDGDPAPEDIPTLDLPESTDEVPADTIMMEEVAEAALDTEQSEEIPGAEGNAEEVVADTSMAPGQTFTDCEGCPQMTVLPAGRFVMGSPEDEPGHVAYEGPQRDVTVQSFAIGTFEVTFDEWQACVDDGGCGGYEPTDSGFGREDRPVLAISWSDANAFARWLSEKTGEAYRLPTEAEWEYAARGGTQTAYWWGARYDGGKATLGQTVSVSSLLANPFGLYGMLSNAREWVQDCYVNNFMDAPVIAMAVTEGDCGRRVVRGGSWRSEPRELRVANRGRMSRDIRDRSMGFRVARDLEVAGEL